jgi:hypothetical protein
MPTNTHVKTRDGLIPIPRPEPRTPQAPGCAAAAVVFGGALVLDADPPLGFLVLVAADVGAADAAPVWLTATGGTTGAAGVGVTAGGRGRTVVTGAAATGALGTSDGRAGVTWRTVVGAAATASAGRAAGDAVMLTRTIAR